MRNSLITQRRWWLAAALLSVLVLAACVAQIPAPAPKPPVAAVATDAPAEEAIPEDATAVPAEEATAVAEEVSGTVEAGAEGAVAVVGGVPIPGDETYKGLPVGFTDEGFAYRGDPDAPIVMVEYSDYGCPFCNRHFIQTEPAVDESFVRTGQVRVVFHDFPLASLHPNAPAAHESSLCVANQESAEAYWNMHAELFRSVEEWQAMPDPLPVFARLAEGTGVDMAVYEACMTSREMASVVQERVDAGFAVGFNATPSFQVIRTTDAAVFEVIGAQPYEQFAGIVASAEAGEMPVASAPETEQPQEEGIPFWATAEGWAEDPDRPGYNMAGDLYRGSLDAPVTVIEFSDFQCPFCQRHTAETQPILDEKYVDTGKVLWIYKHFPLNIHPQAPAAGVAAECAAEQGAFWEMHAALFASTPEWSIENPSDVFASLAADLGLDVDSFVSCLADPAIAERVTSDMNEGAQFVQGTPTFIIVRGAEGSIIPGALPEASFSEVLDEELAKAGVTE